MNMEDDRSATATDSHLAPVTSPSPPLTLLKGGGEASTPGSSRVLTVATLRAAVEALAGPDARAAAAPVIEQWHRELQRDSLARAIRIGMALQARKDEQPAGGWVKWIEDNLSLSRQQVAAYKRVAAWWVKAEMESELSILPATTFTGMVNALKSKKAPRPSSEAVSRSRKCLKARDLIHEGFEQLPRTASQGRTEVLLGVLEHAVGLVAREVDQGTLQPAALRERLQPLMAVVGEPPKPGPAHPMIAPLPQQTPLNLPGSRKKTPKRITSPLTYRGGKRVAFYEAFLPTILANFPRGVTELREPFVGGGAVMLNALQLGLVEQVWINDKDPDVCAVWNAILHHPDELCEAVLMVKKPSRRLMEQAFADLETGTWDGIVDRAVKKLVEQGRSFQATGRKGGCTTPQKPRDPQAKARWGQMLAVRIREAHNLLRGHVRHDVCTNLDFEEVLAAPGWSLTYCDPPWLKVEPDAYHAAVANGFHVRLRNALKRCEGPWMLSYDDCPEIRELYRGKDIRDVRLMRAGKSQNEEGKRDSIELLIMPHETEGIFEHFPVVDYWRTS